ncbi:LuxR family transcriptional regulator [Streptomyces chitinivorans]|uniref:LuxR family transcriptional regulator n=1 Tax=Streptomyces chitinivorans TaxID=1257027 RepID=A0ABW7HYK1_9ACTN|nr:LuxR family transcriptional regulator [Streptomyces chitinivorans]MDH2410291.1 LuxR family transcriptional regulator [Streptomyces chitinivorans]
MRRDGDGAPAQEPCPDTLAAHLSALGVDGGAVALYVALLTGRPAPPASPGARRALLALGLAAEVPAGEGNGGDGPDGEGRDGDGRGARDPAGSLVPVPPASALELLSRRETLRLEEARSAVARAYERYRRRTPSAVGGSVAEEVTGGDIERVLGEALGGARREVLRFDSPPYFWDTERGTKEEVGQLRRGVRYRVVYTRESLARPGYLTENVQPCVDAGEEARVVSGLPVKLMVVDDRVGFVSMSIADVDVSRSMLVVRPSALLAALRALFEAYWDRALPVHPDSGAAAPGGARPGPAERRILAMLVAGVPDSQIIRELGFSRRTFFRRMELLMAQAGAGSRFQLALQAQRRGWL